MKENINKFQPRLDAISEVEVVPHDWGYWYELQIKSSDNRLTSGALTYTQYDNLFDETKSSYSFVGVSNDGAIVNGYIHDGSSKIGRGYGGYSFELTMQDGSHKVISGPWSGRPSVHSVNSGIKYTEVRVNGDSIGFSKEFIQAIIDYFNLSACIEEVVQEKEIELKLYK